MNEHERRELDAWAEDTRAKAAALCETARSTRARRPDWSVDSASERVERRIAEEHRQALRGSGRS